MRTDLINTDDQKLIIIGTNSIQLQIEQDDQEAYIDLSRKEARELAEKLIIHAEAFKPNQERQFP